MYFVLRLVLYCLAAASLAALVAYLLASTMTISNPAGDGWAIGIGWFYTTFLLTPLFALAFCAVLLPRYKNQARIFLMEKVLIVLALGPFAGLVFWAKAEFFSPQSGFQVYEAKKKIQEQMEKKESDSDWNTNESWSLSAPKCLSTAGEAIKNNCPGALRIKYCWTMPADQDWGLRAHDCEKKDSHVITLQPGNQDKQERPWCRSYGGPCLAQFKPLLVEKQISP
jgi:hypothetical protein